MDLIAHMTENDKTTMISSSTTVRLHSIVMVIVTVVPTIITITIIAVATRLGSV